jgi:hypothetical protein
MKIFTVLIVASLFPGFLHAQVGIGTATPDSSSILDLSSFNKGLLVPRMSSVNRGILPSPAEGLLVYQTDTPTGFYYYKNGGWTSAFTAAVVQSYGSVNGGTTAANGGSISTMTTVVEILDNGSVNAAATAKLPITAENGCIIVVGTSDADGAVVFGVSGGSSYSININQSARFSRIGGSWKLVTQ